MQEAAFSVSRAQVYNLRTKWLAAGKKSSFLGSSGGDRRESWPTACVEELKTLIEASKDDGPNFELYADELARKHNFVRDRSSVRKFCEKNLMPLMRSTFPVERKNPDDHYRRWEHEAYPVLHLDMSVVADAALKQCRERNYAARFVGENLPVYYVGVNYNPASDVRTIDDVKCERAE